MALLYSYPFVMSTLEGSMSAKYGYFDAGCDNSKVQRG